MEEDIQDELKYRLLLVRYNEDDPLQEAYLIQKLKETYDKYNVKISEKLKTYIDEELKKIEKYISTELPKKKAEYEKLTAKKSKKIETYEKRHRIFTDEDIAKF